MNNVKRDFTKRIEEKIEFFNVFGFGETFVKLPGDELILTILELFAAIKKSERGQLLNQKN